jgi:hypothetical protein
MRCVLVNDPNLKADAHCTFCRKRIGDSYTREIGSRFIYCDFDCFRNVVQTPIITLGDRPIPINAWMLSS